MLLTGLGSISGISGGVITISFSLLFFNIVTKQATAFSNVISLCVSLVKTCFNISKKDPKKENKTLIDYNLCLIVNPAMIFSNVFGSIINDILPSGIIMSLIMIMVFFGILINIINLIKKIKEENKQIKKNKENKDIQESLKSLQSKNIEVKPPIGTKIDREVSNIELEHKIKEVNV